MKRRELFKMLATLAAMPLVAPLAAWCKSKSDGFTHVQRVTGMRVYEPPVEKNVQVNDWSDNPIAKESGHIRRDPFGYTYRFTYVDKNGKEVQPSFDEGRFQIRKYDQTFYVEEQS